MLKTFRLGEIKCERLKMIEFCEISLCNWPNWNMYLWNLEVRIKAKFTQINSGLFSSALISSRTDFFPEGKEGD